jgi:glutamate dehydrogenase (NADP+)
LEETFKGRRVVVSGSGNVAQYAALKAIELGAVVLSLSDSTGSLIAEDDKGFSVEDIRAIADVKVLRQSITEAGLKKYKFHAGARPWTLVEKIDIALPSATQNEINEEEAKALIKAGCKYVAEGSNMVR